jgi:sec-independent protein translocase protein TatC
MPLREHLAELRRRIIVSCIAIVIGAVVGWFLAQPLMETFIIEPLNRASQHGQKVTGTYRAIADAFNIQVKVSVYIGIVISSPVWIYQLWAFVTPGLTRRERRYSLWFVAFAVPLFLCGVVLAVLVFPKAVAFGADFALKGTLNQPDFGTIITFATRLIIALGTAFLMPLFLVGLNMMGFLSGKALGSHWRIAVFISFLFAAIVSPSPDATQMILLALPLVGLYTISVFICLFNDRRRRRSRENDPVFGMADDEAAPLDDDRWDGDPPRTQVDHPDPLERPDPLDEPLDRD